MGSEKFYSHSIAWRYGLAIATVAGCAVVRWLLNPVLGSSDPFLVFTAGVVAAASFGGLGPGLVATALAAVVGDYFWVDPQHTLFLTEQDEVIRSGVFAGVGVSISWLSGLLKKAQRSAQLANQAKDRFMAILGHELRTPLSPVLQVAGAYEGDPALSPQMQSDMRVVRECIELEARLIDDLVDLTRLAYGKLELRPAKVDVHSLLGKVLRMCNEAVNAKKLQVDVQMDAMQHHVHGDAARLQQVFLNLIKNATKFTPGGGQIKIRTHNEPASGERILIEIRDNGIGIEPRALPSIFNAFEQGHRSITRQFGGLGLGLAICKSLVELHQGIIEAHSEGKGKGAALVVGLNTVCPSAPEEFETAPAPMPAADLSLEGRTLRILLVEDEQRSREVLAQILAKSAHQVSCAASVGSARALAKDRTFDLVISDLGLPDGNGLELMRELKEQYGLVGIALSGDWPEDDIRRSAAAGFAEYLRKPVDLRQLKRVIAEVAGRRLTTEK